MRLFKSDFDELTRESRTSIPASTIHQLSGKALEHSAEFPPPSSLLRRPISQAITNTQLSVPISADSDLKSVGTLKTASIQKPVLCSNNVCLNGGTCVKDRREKEGYRCECAQGWTEIDHCADHDCVSGECINNNDNYTCECLPNFAGQFCTRNCGVDFCKHNGSCVEKHGGELGCDCPAGSAGKRCEKGVLYKLRKRSVQAAQTSNDPYEAKAAVNKSTELQFVLIFATSSPASSFPISFAKIPKNQLIPEINECNFRRCKNALRCIDKWNDYQCVCEPGWMGKNCDRKSPFVLFPHVFAESTDFRQAWPCQDVYGSCKLWKRQGQCELMRDHTNFFDTNCALSCDQCSFLNSTSKFYSSLDETYADRIASSGLDAWRMENRLEWLVFFGCTTL
ncbi:unnamed protein product [Toxocara canis]|uniref:EGF-like domain-containing protein n=1 Tax=Toxocara canis TaxID=6265 RepID=A0A183UB82_TOXCA|nr:unnamed protein product [Toxocara canis]